MKWLFLAFSVAHIPLQKSSQLLQRDAEIVKLALVEGVFCRTSPLDGIMSI
jgi:hypothetical protein